MFLLVNDGHICTPERDTNMTSPYKALKTWVKRFFRIFRKLNIAQKWFLARLFAYLSSFISQILDFRYWIVCIFIFDGVTMKTENCQNWHYYIGGSNGVMKNWINYSINTSINKSIDISIINWTVNSYVHETQVVFKLMYASLWPLFVCPFFFSL